MELSRREFLKTAAAGAAVMAASGIVGPVLAAEAESSAAIGLKNPEWLEESTVIAEPITAWDAEETYDVVVVGAGTAGVPAALSAFEEGASVCVLQKVDCAVSQGNTCSGIDLDVSDDPAIMHYVEVTNKNCNYRGNTAMIRKYFYESGEAVKWYYEQGLAAGLDSMTLTSSPTAYEGLGVVARISVRAGTKPVDTGTAMRAIANMAEEKGVVFHYYTPAVQLVKEEGRVIAVIGERDDGTYIRVNANKGVILATGDYQNNPVMVEDLLPDIMRLDKKQAFKTGDGHLLGILAGGVMEPVGHTKMCHDFDSGPMFDEPFLNVDDNGERFMNEHMEMSLIANVLRTHYHPGWYSQIFDDAYIEKMAAYGGRGTSKENLETYIPGFVENPVGVRKELIDTHRYDTLDELAEALGIPAENLKATVARYNELCDEGFDEDFGKEPKYMQKIDTPPYWGIHKHLRVSAITSGIMSSLDGEVLDESGAPIPGLFVAGNVAGQFYGSTDYPLHMPGMSIGRCVTAGRVLGKYVAKL